MWYVSMSMQPHVAIPPRPTLQIPGGWAAQRYGGRIILMISFFLWSIVSLLTPSDAKSVVAIMTARVCIGVAQGFLIPSIHTVLSQAS